MKKLNFCSLSTLRFRKKNKSKVLSRNSRILDYHVGNFFYIHNGHKFYSLFVSSRMKGHCFGEFCSTRKQFSHKKKAKK
jgi:ribosomal protein S19